jgi:hypothetical protein
MREASGHSRRSIVPKLSSKREPVEASIGAYFSVAHESPNSICRFVP